MHIRMYLVPKDKKLTEYRSTWPSSIVFSAIDFSLFCRNKILSVHTIYQRTNIGNPKRYIKLWRNFWLNRLIHLNIKRSALITLFAHWTSAYMTNKTKHAEKKIFKERQSKTNKRKEKKGGGVKGEGSEEAWLTTTEHIPGNKPAQMIARIRCSSWLHLLQFSGFWSTRPVSFSKKKNCFRRESMAFRVWAERKFLQQYS